MKPRFAYGLPKACICTKCGYIVWNPGTHCPNLRCPKCGGPMRRAWEYE